jgi:hypothetical protein
LVVAPGHHVQDPPEAGRRETQVEIVFLIGAAPYSLPAEEAHRLEDVIRGACVNEYAFRETRMLARASNSPM